MRTHRKLIVAASILLTVGILVCGISFAAFGFNIHALNTVNYVLNDYAVQEDFQNITIRADMEDISFLPSEDGTCKVVCYEDEKELHRVRVEGDTLTIDKEDLGKWRIGIITESPKLTLYLPNLVYGALWVDADTGSVTVPAQFTFESIHVKLDTGNIELTASAQGEVDLHTDTGGIDLSDLSAGGIALSTATGTVRIDGVACQGSLDAKTDTGRIDIANTRCANLHSTGSTGSLYLTNVIASKEYHIRRATGNVRLDGCDAENIFIETDTGDVTGTLLTDKIFLPQTDTGRIDVPKTTVGGRCEISTDTGNIQISVP
ncbi:MAG: DUF4097 family beta strand repeat protein [Clostridia bacterium]|nr:DUF4097 family beta strand repeat protein [Clostridia bacterium]